MFGGTIPDVKDPLTYRVEFGNGQTSDFHVAVFDYPDLQHADARIAFPEYTRLPPKTIIDTRRVSAVEGSSLTTVFI